jgi:hypothetical protein
MRFCIGQLFLTITRPDTPILCGRFPSLSFNALWSRGSPFGGVGGHTRSRIGELSGTTSMCTLLSGQEALKQEDLFVIIIGVWALNHWKRRFSLGN